jgi:hypothetical protein
MGKKHGDSVVLMKNLRKRAADSTFCNEQRGLIGVSGAGLRGYARDLKTGRA